MTRWMAIAALAALGGTLSACGPSAPDPTTSGPVAKTSPTTASPTTPSTTTTHPGAAAPVAYRWSRVSPSAVNLGREATSTLSAVLPPSQSNDEWLLAGTRTAAGGVTDATIWTSSDATSWVAAALRGGAGGQARAAAAWGQRTVVVGSVGDGKAQRAAVWISPSPGVSFSRVPDSPALGVPAGSSPDLSGGSAEPTGASATFATTAGPGAVMDGVTAGALGIFASGTVAGQFALWYSTNGTNWVRLTKAESVIDSSPGAVVRQVLETSEGVFAVGSMLHDGTTDAALWTSGDGMNWRLVPNSSSFAGPGDQVLSSISSFGTNLVVGGGIRRAASWMPASWISPNLSTWGAPSDAFAEPTGKRLDLAGSVVADLSVSPDGTTLAAVGGSPSEQRLWLSDDGINWTPVPFPQGAADDADWTAGAVATTGTTTVVIDTLPGQPRLLVDGTGGWREVSADPAVFGSPQTVATPTHLVDEGGRLVMTVDVDQPGQVLGEDRHSTEILSSTDGRHWTVAATGGTFLGQTVTGLAATPKGLVAVGGPSPTTAAVVSGELPREPTVTVWRSTDASAWTAVDLDAHGVVASSALTSGRASSHSLAAGSTTSSAPRAGSTTTPAPARRGATTAVSATTSAPASSSATTAPAPVMPVPTAYQMPRAAVAFRGNTIYVASSFGANPVTGWESSDGKNWTPMGTLGQAPVAEPDAVSGGCVTPQGAVVVGATAGGQGGSTGMVWPLSRPGASATVGPMPPTDSVEELVGCTDTATGSVVAWGASASTSGIPTAALWSSPTGLGWTRSTVAAFTTTNGTAAITDLATNGHTWLALTGSSTESWTEDRLSALGVWESADAGKTWEQLNTAASSWSGRFGVSADLVAYLGVDPVIAGDVDGRLTLWQGTPTP